MNTVEIIKKKREGDKLTPDELKFMIHNYSEGTIPDYQISSFLMAVYFRGMDKEETANLTDLMLHSGKTFDFDDIKGKKVDKHSTGGVGDKTSLIIAPVVAAAGVYVPMISGRGLGHTGGTLDKLESIPGFRTGLSFTECGNLLKKSGMFLAGQTAELVPADRKLYALRDVTGTIESIPLITGSIMSKKLAEGIDGLVLDVKTGTGAFMKEYDRSTELAESLTATAKAFGKEVIAMITDMNQPLGKNIGNWLEVEESLRILRGETVFGLSDLSLKLAGAMIWLGGKAESQEEGEEISKEIISSGKAFDKFLEISEKQGGDISYLKDPGKFPAAKYAEEVFSEDEGWLAGTDNYKIGMAALELGAGRKVKEDLIDPTAGIIFYPEIGDKIDKDKPIAKLFTNKKETIERVKKVLKEALVLEKAETKAPPLIYKTIS